MGLSLHRRDRIDKSFQCYHYIRTPPIRCHVGTTLDLFSEPIELPKESIQGWIFQLHQRWHHLLPPNLGQARPTTRIFYFRNPDICSRVMSGAMRTFLSDSVYVHVIDDEQQGTPTGGGRNSGSSGRNPGTSSSSTHSLQLGVPQLEPPRPNILAELPNQLTGKPVNAKTEAADEDWYTSAFPPLVMWQVLQMCEELKETADIRKVVKLALQMVLSPAEAKIYTDRLDSREIRIPKAGAIRNAKQKLDVLAMHYMAWVYDNFNVLAYDIIDSSPQRGWNFLVTRTDEFCIPKTLTPKQRMALDLSDVYMQRTLPLSCLGYPSRYNV